ncbi:putative serine/threonine protein kinase [Peziza echinospora]|nr:putative serine/threonine protein kinase [Peziza echinospora]
MVNHSQLDPLPTDLPFEVISKTIGRGAYASIKKGRDLVTGTIFAVKFIHKPYATSHGSVTLRQIDMECTLHYHAGKHANIIEFYSTGQDSIWRWIAMEFAEGGDLFDKIEADVGVSEDIAHFYFMQLLAGVSYLHGKGIAHRDIKPENMLLDRDGNLKIADFGLAALFYYQGRSKLCTTLCGSPPYVAPEVAVGPYQGNVSDIWSCGVVLFVLLAGNTPWDEPSEHSWEFREYKRNRGRIDDELWQKLPSDVLSLLRGMMKIDTNTRMTLEDIRRHPWFTRRNSFLADNGRCRDRILLATKLMEGLHIDFSKPPAGRKNRNRKENENPSSTNGSGSDVDHEMADGDEDEEETSQEPAFVMPSTQPINPTVVSSGNPHHAHLHMDWERRRPHHLHFPHIQHGISSSQPTTRAAPDWSPKKKKQPVFPKSAAKKNPTQDPSSSSRGNSNNRILAALNEDPTMSQFFPQPHIPTSLTQAAQKFRDVCPAQSLTRFYSQTPLNQLFAVLAEALHRVGVSVPPIHVDEDEGEGVDVYVDSDGEEVEEERWMKMEPVWIKVRTMDSRRCHLAGDIVIEKVDREMAVVEFTKTKGDPLEWRRFFKKVVVLSKEAVYVGNPDYEDEMY